MHLASRVVGDTPVPREELVKAIVHDDELFRELKKRLRATGVVTNECAQVFLNSSILETMKPEVSARRPRKDSARSYDARTKLSLSLSPCLVNQTIPKFVITGEGEHLHPQTPANVARLPLEKLLSATTDYQHRSLSKRSPWSINAFAAISSRFMEHNARPPSTSVTDRSWTIGFMSPDQPRENATSMKRSSSEGSKSLANRIRRSFGSPFALSLSFTPPCQVTNGMRPDGPRYWSVQDLKSDENLHDLKYKAVENFETPGIATILGLLNAKYPSKITVDSMRAELTGELHDAKALLSAFCAFPNDNTCAVRGSVDAAQQRRSLWSPEVLAEMLGDVDEDDSN